jgi:hypothetical protein
LIKATSTLALDQREALTQTGDRIVGLESGPDADALDSRWVSHAKEKGARQPSRCPMVQCESAILVLFYVQAHRIYWQ